MNREILFRGRKKGGTEWFEGDLSYLVYDKRECYIFPADGCNSPDWYEVDPDTVGQYTGLSDKNGKRIFEGDFIKVSTFGFGAKIFATEVVFMDRAGMRGFCLKNGRSLFYYGQKDLNKMDDAEVIGNRWDNPELLEVKGKDA